ncbi:NEDD4 family-interacting protein 1-like [Agrilus planipennis]|uniref:NEDD4 family-interacting protein 1-like n=1 Tax=Agrilus planipennis TaxID=224129 RepID=A0A1W4X8R7_AGRPL|nr:NEDD4 family-interacting protein 1-like [Agrilus planipennis]XP_018328731.1 NEDD4 family-interacting protein 1-like [Agrilus planipennis]XP_018328732.1 NEDD4 family-interacting protein 1-like [Agrilus planipennis]
MCDTTNSVNSYPLNNPQQNAGSSEFIVPVITPTSPNLTYLPSTSSCDDIPPPKPDYSAPPPYEIATKLPTYEEVQREKVLESNNPLNYSTCHINTCNINARQRVIVDAEAIEEVDTTLLGTDFMFYTAFFVAFVFNWIGFLLLTCFCHTIASRYGALSGFGLSLAKWTLIVKHSTDLASSENSWLWWLIMTFGLIICIRAILQYLNIKRGWHLLSTSHQERLLFFY